MKKIHINLPVKNLKKSMGFYTASDEYQKCMVWGEQIYVMLMSQEKFKSYSKKAIPNVKNSLTTYFTLPVESLESVNEIVQNGFKAGGTEPISMIDESFMQLRRIEDFDGHTWDIVYMDLSKFKNQ